MRFVKTAFAIVARRAGSIRDAVRAPFRQIPLLDRVRFFTALLNFSAQAFSLWWLLHVIGVHHPASQALRILGSG